ncbi:MAG: N-methyl-L-tryptophan oxidase [Bacteroidota bacterium]|nr:N-methyl-L-tryptophan oxidase [Bacteroidota bacterium]
MNNTFDVIVLGLGANGSSALYHLSKTGLKVVGIDRFTPPHTHGSSHGESRIIRQAYHEHPMYVPLVKEAYKLWYELESTWKKQLFLQTGGIMLGDINAGVVKGAKKSAETHGIAYEYLESDDINQRFPALKTTKETVGVVEKEAGILFPEECIKANLQLSAHNGAVLLFDEKVISIHPHYNGVDIFTDKSKYQTRKLIVSAGAWLNQLLPSLHLPLTIERQVLYWFTNTDISLQPYLLPNALPIYIWEYEQNKTFYGFPDLGKGIKVAPHHAGKTINPDLISQEVSEAEVKNMSGIVDEFLTIKPQFSHSSVCMYTKTPDEHFIIDFHPQHHNIIIGSPCSGHGFKFSSLTGKILCDMAMEKQVPFDLKPFAITRFR